MAGCPRAAHRGSAAAAEGRDRESERGDDPIQALRLGEQDLAEVVEAEERPIEERWGHGQKQAGRLEGARLVEWERCPGSGRLQMSVRSAKAVGEP